jgi:tRNA-dihydrouridine synthase B
LVKEIITAIVEAVDIPVTLKIRTGWESSKRNALKVAAIAEDCGISSLAVHGRTRNQAYTGFAEYETIRQIKKAVSIPVIANGDILEPKDVEFIFDYTAVDAVMLGRITHGQPWIFKELNEQLKGDFTRIQIPTKEKIKSLLIHIDAIHRHYGTDQGVRIARKHIGWYLSNLIKHDQNLLKALKKEIFVIADSAEQYDVLESKLSDLIE